MRFSLGSGSFHGGTADFAITKIDGDYFFTASGGNGLEMFVETPQWIPSQEVDTLRHIMEAGGVGAWDGFYGSDENVLDGFGFNLSVEMEGDISINARGYERFPENFDEVFPLLSSHLADMAFRYRTAQEWGDLVHITYYVVLEHGFYVYSLTVEEGNQIHFAARTPETRPAMGVEGVVDFSALEEVRRLVVQYGVDQWYGDTRNDPENNRYMSVRVSYDNGGAFSIGGYLAPDGFEAANEALLTFFAELLEQI